MPGIRAIIQGKVEVLVALSCPTLCDHGLQSTRILWPWDFPGKNTGVGSHSLLQGIFLTHGSNVCLLHCRWILYGLSHQVSPLPRDEGLIREVRADSQQLGTVGIWWQMRLLVGCPEMEKEGILKQTLCLKPCLLPDFHLGLCLY